MKNSFEKIRTTGPKFKKREIQKARRDYEYDIVPYTMEELAALAGVGAKFRQ